MLQRPWPSRRPTHSPNPGVLVPLPLLASVSSEEEDDDDDLTSDEEEASEPLRGPTPPPTYLGEPPASHLARTTDARESSCDPPHLEDSGHISSWLYE